MSDYRKPSKQQRNEAFLRSIGLSKEPYLEERIDPNKLFLIICEGENTEPEYFKSFPVTTNKVIIQGGCNTKNMLVDYAIALKSHPKYSDREIWCVFDFDIKPDEAGTQPEDFNSSIAKAEANGLRVAWSNDAFELWFLLHYQNLTSELRRDQIYPLLKAKWGLESFSREAKVKAFCKGLYNLHGGSESEGQQMAIRRAKELHASFDGRTDYHSHCPCTTVYALVEELNKYLKR